MSDCFKPRYPAEVRMYQGSGLVYCCLITLCVIVQSTAFPAQKRIFCNFDGCHNKRSAITYPDDKLLSDLLTSPDKQVADYGAVGEQSLEESAYRNEWDDVIRALLRQLTGVSTRRQTNSPY